MLTTDADRTGNVPRPEFYDRPIPARAGSNFRIWKKSLGAQAIHRIGQGDFDALEADRQQRNSQRVNASHAKNPSRWLGAVLVLLKPVVQEIVRQGRGDEEGHEDHRNKFP